MHPTEQVEHQQDHEEGAGLGEGEDRDRVWLSARQLSLGGACGQLGLCHLS